MHRAPVMALAALALTLTACGKKGGSPDAAAENSGSGSGDEAAFTAEMPDSKDARTFAEKLVQTTVTDWQPISGGGARFVYTELTFLPSGRWAAQAFFEANFEKMECKEAGTWSIEDVESDRTATMVWAVDKTNCAGREAGTEQRVQMVVPKAGEYKINFR